MFFVVESGLVTFKLGNVSFFSSGVFGIFDFLSGVFNRLSKVIEPGHVILFDESCRLDKTTVSYFCFILCGEQMIIGKSNAGDSFETAFGGVKLISRKRVPCNQDQSYWDSKNNG